MSKLLRTRLVVLLLVAALGLMVFPLAASADPAPEDGRLIIHKFLGPHVGGDDPTGELLDDTGFGIPINGVKFNLYKIGDPTDSEWPAVPGVGPYSFDSSAMTMTDGASHTYAVTAADPASVTTAANVEFSADGIAVADLDQGIYLVVEDIAGSSPVDGSGDPINVTSRVANFVVSVPMTNPEGDGWLVDVHVYPKNESMTVTKTSDKPTGVAVGETITYTITSDVPEDMETVSAYSIYDLFDACLTPLASTGSTTGVTAKGVEGSTDITLTFPTDYTVTVAGQKVTVALTLDGIAKLKNADQFVVTLAAQTNSGILAKTGLVWDNDATLEFVNAAGDPFERTSDKTENHTHGLRVHKKNESGQALSGAAFALYLDDDGELGAKVGDLAADTDIHEILGLVAGDYWLVETLAPSGYNLLAKPVKVTVPENAANNMHEIDLANSRGFTLPLTGDIGTITLTVAGIALVGFAVMVASKKKSQVSA